MANNVVFNMTVCIMGILILFVHMTNLILKANKRVDEKWLLAFISFTIFHFAVYLTFCVIKIYYTSDPFIIASYTTFYIMNNIEVILLSMYTLYYVVMPQNKKKHVLVISIFLFIVFVVLDIVNLFTGIFFYSENGEYMRSKTMILSQGYQFIAFSTVLLVTFINNKINMREKIAFATYCILPLISILVQNVLKGYAIAYATIIISVEILFFFVNVQKNIELAEQQEKTKEAQIKIMLSQIQPHFIYNSLSSISTLIDIDPEKAQRSLDDFTEYLRMNLSSITKDKSIPFKEELRHIETYVALEKLRFNDRIHIVYDLGIIDFKVPTLTIQPLVENAIKHGILKKIEGGTVTLTTYETDTCYVVEIKDDGIGFDISEIDFDEGHFGLKNISYRISKTCVGDLSISSKVNVGTKITVKFKK